MGDVAVVIPNWNRAGLLERALLSVSAQTERPAEVLVVDNGSTDDSVERAERAGAVVIRLPRNAGFSVAVNEGVRRCGQPWVLVLNNDAELESGSLALLRRAARETGAAFAAPLVLSATSEKTVDAAFDLVARSGCAYRAGHGCPLTAEFEKRRAIWFAPFTAVLVSREVFLEQGGLNERLETYMEDTEFCLRVALSGRSGIYEPGARVRHLGSATHGKWSAEMVRRLARNQVWLVAMHWPRPMPPGFARAVLAGQLLWGVAALGHGRAGAWLAGKWEGLRGWGRLRRGAPVAGGEMVARLLEESEAEIRRLATSGYWRTYFRTS